MINWKKGESPVSLFIWLHNLAYIAAGIVLCFSTIMPNCAVATCRNNNRNTKGTNIKYHQFPKAANVCSALVHACKRKDKINKSVQCSLL